MVSGGDGAHNGCDCSVVVVVKGQTESDNGVIHRVQALGVVNCEWCCTAASCFPSLNGLVNLLDRMRDCAVGVDRDGGQTHCCSRVSRGVVGVDRDDVRVHVRVQHSHGCCSAELAPVPNVHDVYLFASFFCCLDPTTRTTDRAARFAKVLTHNTHPLGFTRENKAVHSFVTHVATNQHRDCCNEGCSS